MIIRFLLFSFFILANTNTHHLPGGEFSSNDWSQQAFNHPLSNATSIEKQQFGVGNSFFKQAWVEFPSSTIGRDGLGPVYNAVACASCHVKDGRGVGYIDSKVNLSLLVRISSWNGIEFTDHPEYGQQLQPLGISQVKGELDIDVEFEYINGQYPDGESYELRKPHLIFSNFKGSPFDEDTVVSPRVAPQVIGLGFIEAIEAADILAQSDPTDVNNDGISGRAKKVLDKETGLMKLGRFGWKAGQPSLRQQNAAAFIGDMGLTSEFFPEQNCFPVQLDCLNSPEDTELEVSKKVLDRVTIYTQITAVPKSRNTDSTDFEEGRLLFSEVSCAKCHKPRFVTGDFHEVKALRNQKIWPYSDFLLHDMGEGLADHRPEGGASGLEWRTPPLWSIGLIKTVNKHSNLLHDARARNIEEAILWHGGEAESAKEKFMLLKKEKRKQLIYFVESI